MPINADVKDFLAKMCTASYEVANQHAGWLSWCRQLVEKYPAVLPEYHHKKGLINPYVLIERLFGQLKDDDRIITGNGAACVITFQACKIKQGQRLFTNSGCAAMGYGFPAALGVAVSDNTKRTVCIDGDGSFMMNLQELATVAWNKLNLKIIILNNNGYLSIRQTQRNLFQPPFIGIDEKSGVGFPNFEKLADAFGVGYYVLRGEDESDSILTKALESDGPCIIEAVVDPDQNFAPKSSSKVLPDGRITSPSLDDMAPFLPREEFDSIKFA